MQADLFTYLAVGLVAHEQKGTDYPYPDLLRHGLNRLVARMIEKGRELPITMTAFMELFHHPLKQWWPEEDLPPGIEDDLPLLYEGRLEEQVVEFLEGLSLPSYASLPQIEAILSNQAIEELLRILRDLYHTQPAQAQVAYTQIRLFLIQHPHTTNLDLLQHLGRIREIDLRLIQQMYEPAQGNPELLHNSQYWQCPHCTGLLRWANGYPRCAKPSVCARIYPDYAGRQPLNPSADVLVLRWGVHARTTIPGLREIALFQELSSEPYMDQIKVILWPGIDRYDLQLRFRDDEVWAIDVKDYKNPIELGRKIAADTLYDLEPNLRWRRGFYVVPFYRTDQHASRSDYLAQVRKAVGKTLPGHISIVDEAGLKVALTAKLARMH